RRGSVAVAAGSARGRTQRSIQRAHSGGRMNAHVLDRRSIAGVPSPRRVLGAYLEEIRCEALRLLRNPGLAFPVLVMPVALYALIALVVAGEATADDPLVGVFMF